MLLIVLIRTTACGLNLDSFRFNVTDDIAVCVYVYHGIWYKGNSYVYFYISGRTIQKKTHCSEEDALATLDLFKLVRHQWEAEIANTSKSDLSRKRTVSENSLDNSFLNDRFWPGDL